MEEIKIWAIDGSDVTEVQRTDQTESEQWLEDNLVSKPELLIPGLTLVGRQTQTEGGPLDLLGVDSDGRLVVFELKRGTLSRDAVAQIIDYASYLESMNPDALSNYIATRSGENGIEKIEDFGEWHAENTAAESLDSLLPLRMFLVGLGVDDRTERMVSFLADNGVNITLLTFYGFVQDGKTLLARQIRVEGTREAASHGVVETLSYAERFENLLNYAGQQGVRSLFTEVQEMFREHWHSPSMRINKGQQSANMLLRVRNESGRRRSRQSVYMYPEESAVIVQFFAYLTQMCEHVFRSDVAPIPYEGSTREGITFRLRTEDWETHGEAFGRLAGQVYESVQKYNRGESDASSDGQTE